MPILYANEAALSAADTSGAAYPDHSLAETTDNSLLWLLDKASALTVSGAVITANPAGRWILCGSRTYSVDVDVAFTTGDTSAYVDSAAPATATLSNTVAGYGSGLLGGQFRFAAPAGAETDFILFAYQVPAAAINAHNKKFVCVGVTIDTFNEVVAVATTGTVMQWGLSVGSTAASLATAEGATTKAARRFPVGVQSFAVGDPVGKAAERLSCMFPKGAELVANPGEFLGVILKVAIGTATATETFRGVVSLLGHWELG